MAVFDVKTPLVNLQMWSYDLIDQGDGSTYDYDNNAIGMGEWVYIDSNGRIAKFVQAGNTPAAVSSAANVRVAFPCYTPTSRTDVKATNKATLLRGEFVAETDQFTGNSIAVGDQLTVADNGQLIEGTSNVVAVCEGVSSDGTRITVRRVNTGA